MRLDREYVDVENTLTGADEIADVDANLHIIWDSQG